MTSPMAPQLGNFTEFSPSANGSSAAALPKPKPEAKPKPKPEPEAKPKPKPEPEAKPKPKPEPEAKPDEPGGWRRRGDGATWTAADGAPSANETPADAAAPLRQRRGAITVVPLGRHLHRKIPDNIQQKRTTKPTTTSSSSTTTGRPPKRTR